MGTKVVPGHTWAPQWYPGTCRHQNGARANVGTGMVPGHEWAPEWCTGTYGHRNGAWAHIGNGRVPVHILAQNGACARMGTKMVPGYIWVSRHMAPVRCLDKYGHIWTLDVAPEGCPGIFGQRNYTWANMGTGWVLGHI